MIKNDNNFIREFFPKENCIFSENCQLLKIFLKNISLLILSKVLILIITGRKILFTYL